MTKDLKISIFGLDDDEDTLDIMEHIFLDNGIGEYSKFYREEDFCASFNDNVHIAIIDHYLHGEPRGFDIMKKIHEYNKSRQAIDCRVIIISGQRKYEVVKHYLNNGAKGYIDKDDPNFSRLLVEYVSREIAEVKKILNLINILTEQRQFITEQTTQKKDE